MAAAEHAERRNVEPQKVGRLLNEIGVYLHSRAGFADAEPFHRRALAIREEALGPGHPDVAQSLSNLGLLHHAQGHFEDAEPLYLRSLAIWEEVVPDQAKVAYGLNTLAELYPSPGPLRRCRTPSSARPGDPREGAGKDHIDVAQSLNNLALLRYVQGRCKGVEPLLRRALAIWERHLGPPAPRGCLWAQNLGTL